VNPATLLCSNLTAVKGGIKKGVDVYFFFSENIFIKKKRRDERLGS